MKNNCKVIADLLPLYLDKACSDESKMIVEEHLKECEECRMLANDMKENITDEQITFTNDEEVLKKTAWIINKKSMKFAIGITLIVIYWIIYFWQEGLADIGDYRYFSYRFSEIFSPGFLYIPIVTLIWFVIFIVKTAIRKTWKKSAVPALILALLLSVQSVFVYNLLSINGRSTFAVVTEISDPYHIVIKMGEQYATLETTPLVTSLVDIDNTLYSLSYDYNKHTPEKGKLNEIHPVHQIEDIEN